MSFREHLKEHGMIVEAVSAEKVIKDLAATDFKGSNQEQMKGVQLLKGLAVSDEEISNKFMEKLSDAYTNIAKEIGVEKSEE